MCFKSNYGKKKQEVLQGTLITINEWTDKPNGHTQNEEK